MVKQVIKWQDEKGGIHATQEEALEAERYSQFLHKTQGHMPIDNNEEVKEIWVWLHKHYDMTPRPTLENPTPSGTPGTPGVRSYQGASGYVRTGWLGYSTMRHAWGVLPAELTLFKEPGTGLWMDPNYLYVITDSGAYYTAIGTTAPMVFTISEPGSAVAALRGNKEFMAENDLDEAHVGTSEDVDNLCPHACNVVRGADLLRFWHKTDPTQLEYR